MTDNPSNPSSDTSIESRPYLGDPQVVDKILRHVAREGVNCRAAIRKNILTAQDANLIDEKETTNAAAILLGRNRRYAIDSNWNIPGVIDAFIAKELEIEAKGPESIVAAGLCKFLAEIDDRLKRVNRTEDPDWEKHVDDIFEKYRNVLLGLSVAPAVDLPPEAPQLPVAAAAPLVDSLIPVPVAKPSIPAVPPPKPVPASMPAQAETTAAAPGSSRGRKLALAALLLLLLLGGTFFFLRKPAPPAPPPQAQTPPPPPKPVPAATAVVMDGKIHLLKENGETQKEIALANTAESIVRLFDAYLEAGNEQFLVSKSWKQPDSEDGPVSNDLWLLDHAGNERFINPSVLHARMSVDGSKIAYSTSEAILQVEDKAGAELAEVEGVYEPVWRKENEVVFLMVPEGHKVWPPDALSIATLDVSTKAVTVVTDGRFDDVVLEAHPSQKWLLLTAGAETGLPSFWKVPATGGEPFQITNVRMNESDEQWIPTPFQTAIWSKDGKWFLYDFKDGMIEQTWGLEFDDNGNFKRAARLADGLYPRWADDQNFMCMKRKGDGFELVVEKLPEL
jgi:hypothetical protein